MLHVHTLSSPSRRSSDRWALDRKRSEADLAAYQSSPAVDIVPGIDLLHGIGRIYAARRYEIANRSHGLPACRGTAQLFGGLLNYLRVGVGFGGAGFRVSRSSSEGRRGGDEGGRTCRTR